MIGEFGKGFCGRYADTDSNTYPAIYGVLYLLPKINQRNSGLNTGEI
mgnify:CR=1 FL=1